MFFDSDGQEPTTEVASMGRIAAAWAVHAFTAFGAACCLFALCAAADAAWKTMFLWLAAAVVIDAVDGTLARAVKIKQTLPHFDGTLLDSIVDYAGYVLVPAFALGRSDLLPESWSWPIGALICLASAFQFCQVDAKTSDHFFKGFPSYWNIVLFYLFVLPLSATTNAAILIGLAVFVFVPLKFVYPTRTPQFRRTTLALSALWAATILGMLVQFPHPTWWLTAGSLLYVVYYVVLSLRLTVAVSP